MNYNVITGAWINTSLIRLVLLCCIVIMTLGRCKDDTHSITKSENNNQMVLIPSTRSGITFSNSIKESWDINNLGFNYMYNGAGVAVGDINQDGLPDIYLVGNMTPNKLYLNQGGFKFEDVSVEAGVQGGKEWSTGTIMADVNGDGWLDIYVTRGGWLENAEHRKNLLFINQKDGTFKEEGHRYGIDDAGFSIAAVFFDMDNDGDLDLYVTNRPKEFHHSIEEDLAGRVNASEYERDHLFRNDGNGHFTDVSKSSGIINNNYGYGLGVAAADLNNDGYIDIYVSNDFIENDYCYLNQGNGTFKQVIREVTNHTSFYSMGLDVTDLNNDSYEEILATEMLPADYWRAKVTMAPMMSPKEHNYLFEEGHFHFQYMHNSVQLNRGNGSFSEISNYSGLKHTDWSWAVLGSDFDNDGMRDVFIANGYLRDIFDNDSKGKVARLVDSIILLRKAGKPVPDIQKVIDLFPSNPLHNYIFKNVGNLKFEDKSKDWGMTQKTFSNGAAIGDFDQDGDLDLVINNLNQEAQVYENKISQGHYLRIRLKGPSLNTFGLGAKVFVYAQGRLLYEEFKTARGYISSVEPRLHFGLGSTEVVDSVVVYWPDKKRSKKIDVKADQVLTISYEMAKPSLLARPSSPKLEIFKQVLHPFTPPFFHKENRYQDFRTQVLLPHRHSEQSPILAVGDVNSDGLQDIYIGSSLLQAGVLYVQTTKGSFEKKSNPLFEEDRGREDGGAAFFDVDQDGDLDLYVSSGGTEFGVNSDKYQDRLYLNDGHGRFTKRGELPAITISGSCVKPMDYDGDGDVDVFVGGRIVPDYYPYAPNSFILKNEKGKLIPDEASVKMFDKVGMVTDAVWADLNEDHRPDLILVGEWMPISVFIQSDTGFIQSNKSYGTPLTHGWWNRIAAGDLDGDGDEDFVVGNIGQNYKFKASKEKPFHIYAADFDKDGTYDPYLAKNYQGKLVPIRGRQCSSQELNYIKDKFPSYRAFAAAEVKDILGEEMENSLHMTAEEFSSVVLINEKDHFEIVPLPYEAQLSWVTGIIIDDYNKDGHKDILLAGNMFEPEPETTRADAFSGLLLINKGDGKHYAQYSGAKCGFFLPDNVRDIRAISLGKEKAKGVVVGINEGPIKLFHTFKNFQ